MSIKELREKRNLTQQQLADSIGVTKQAVSAFENGKCKMSVKLAKAIGEEYGIEWYLFFENEGK